MGSFDFASLTLREACPELAEGLRTNGCDSFSPFVLSVATRSVAKSKGQVDYSDRLLVTGGVAILSSG